MTWTDSDFAQIIDDFWNVRASSCPDDGSPLSVRFERTGKTYSLLARCPECGKDEAVGPEHDPEKETFRKWTEEECARVEGAEIGVHPAPCPVCGAPIDAHPFALDTVGQHIVYDCFRCGNSHSRVRRLR